MRFARFMVLIATAAALAGCMQSGGSGVFARDAQPPWKQQLAMPTALPAMLRPAPVRMAAAPVMAEPLMAPAPDSSRTPGSLMVSCPKAGAPHATPVAASIAKTAVRSIDPLPKGVFAVVGGFPRRGKRETEWEIDRNSASRPAGL